MRTYGCTLEVVQADDAQMVFGESGTPFTSRTCAELPVARVHAGEKQPARQRWNDG